MGDKGRLSKEEIEKMVQDAEKYKDEDDKLRKKVDAKNGLESYIFQMKNTLTDEKLKDKFEEADKTTIEDASKEGLQFLESNPDASAEEYEAKQKEIEAKFNPIMQKVYQAAGGAPGGMPVCQVVCQVAWEVWAECQIWAPLAELQMLVMSMISTE